MATATADAEVAAHGEHQTSTGLSNTKLAMWEGCWKLQQSGRCWQSK